MKTTSWIERKDLLLMTVVLFASATSQFPVVPNVITGFAPVAFWTSWHYSAATKSCKCPMCSHEIKKLNPVSSLLNCQEADITGILRKVEQYNHLNVEGMEGLFQRIRESPLFIKRLLRDMMDPDRESYYVYTACLFAMLLGILFLLVTFKFLPMDSRSRYILIRMFDHAAVILVYILQLIGSYLRRRHLQRVRHLGLINN